MPKVELNTPAPVFALPDYQGNSVSLAEYRGSKNVLVVLNRGFI